MTIMAIGWIRGNKKALATILPTKYWDKLRALPKFDYYDIAAAHKIMKRRWYCICNHEKNSLQRHAIQRYTGA
ncbi:MAG: hypothetical protein WAK17_17335 [Candidatus Nitrosopolaris sp.]|jgi:hypothetical protein